MKYFFIATTFKLIEYFCISKIDDVIFCCAGMEPGTSHDLGSATGRTLICFNTGDYLTGLPYMSHSTCVSQITLSLPDTFYLFLKI